MTFIHTRVQELAAVFKEPLSGALFRFCYIIPCTSFAFAILGITSIDDESHSFSVYRYNLQMLLSPRYHNPPKYPAYLFSERLSLVTHLSYPNGSCVRRILPEDGRFDVDDEYFGILNFFIIYNILFTCCPLLTVRVNHFKSTLWTR